MIFRREKPTLDLETYRRWLRAHRPPMDLFLGLNEMEQEALATEGDAYILHCTLLGHDEEDDAPESDESQMERVALDLARKIATRASNQTAGFGDQRTPASRATKLRDDSRRRLFGRTPDPVPTEDE